MGQLSSKNDIHLYNNLYVFLFRKLHLKPWSQHRPNLKSSSFSSVVDPNPLLIRTEASDLSAINPGFFGSIVKKLGRSIIAMLA